MSSTRALAIRHGERRRAVGVEPLVPRDLARAVTDPPDQHGYPRVPMDVAEGCAPILHSPTVPPCAHGRRAIALSPMATSLGIPRRAGVPAQRSGTGAAEQHSAHKPTKSGPAFADPRPRGRHARCQGGCLGSRGEPAPVYAHLERRSVIYRERGRTCARIRATSPFASDQASSARSASGATCTLLVRGDEALARRRDDRALVCPSYPRGRGGSGDHAAASAPVSPLGAGTRRQATATNPNLVHIPVGAEVRLPAGATGAFPVGAGLSS